MKKFGAAIGAAAIATILAAPPASGPDKELASALRVDTGNIPVAWSWSATPKWTATSIFGRIFG